MYHSHDFIMYFGHWLAILKYPCLYCSMWKAAAYKVVTQLYTRYSFHRPSSRVDSIKTSSNTAYEMKAIPEAPQQQYEPVDCDTNKVPSNMNDAYEVTLPHLPASSGAGAEDEMMYETVTAEND